MFSENKKRIEVKRLIKPWLLIFLVSFLVINWQDVAWLFNWRILWGISKMVLLERAEPSLASPAPDESQELVLPDRLEVPRLALSIPIVKGRSLAPEELEEDLDRGVVWYPSSSLPGQRGQTILLGHSASEGWPKINYDWVFSEINNLEKGQEIIIYAAGQRYVYRVNQTTILDPGDEIPAVNPRVNSLVLVSCWPPGKNLRRIAVEALLVN